MIEWEKLAPWDQEKLCVEFSAKFGHADPCVSLVMDDELNITMQRSSVDLTLNEAVSFTCL